MKELKDVKKNIFECVTAYAVTENFWSCAHTDPPFQKLHNTQSKKRRSESRPTGGLLLHAATANC